MEKLKLKYNMSDLWQAHNQGVGAGVRTPFHPRPAAKRAKGQLRRIRKSLDRESATTLVHAFVTSRVDYCNAVYAAIK